DLTYRAVHVLGDIRALACEDTRHTRRLLERYGIEPPKVLLSYHEHNEERATVQILDLLSHGKDVGLCSDAGLPGISDPGYRIISQAADRGYGVTAIPGGNAVELALVVSGLPTSSYTFKGFPPRKPGPRKRYLEQDRDLPHTLIFYESPFRLSKLLDDALAVLGDRRAAVCRELTKMHEETARGWLSELSERFRDAKVKGEITVVIAGNNPKFLRSNNDAEQDCQAAPL
ncbi:MAG: 16S rRNA (cytidine(1402)-2'-O)-methyltransferase, partial [Chitinivibrionales bacterium]|nr:16S rRNA (cytidine(1402)-2'-O)-methyltransferase [Chitinivibrionales bacterium]MBD3357588.1 16S rRNA (cytidine(1402)-2'-O)-methyltransferase [Chitinivibrionales bacterium]